jgi:hypothetical protein
LRQIFLDKNVDHFLAEVLVKTADSSYLVTQEGLKENPSGKEG